MNISQKPIDKEYLRLFSAYCETLCSISNDEWDYHIVGESIRYIYGMFFSEIVLKESVPEEFSTVEYLYDKDTDCMIPPDCRWISKSGRFTCHDIYMLIGGQAYILWDLQRKVALPLIFHDLEGIDEENGFIFGRTMSPIHRHDMNSPMAVDLNWINLLNYCKSTPDHYPGSEPHTLSIEEMNDIASSGILRLRNEKDLFSHFDFPKLESISRRNIQLLDDDELSEKEKQNLVGELLFHPYFEDKCEDWIFDALFAYTDDMDKCHKIAACFGFENFVKEEYQTGLQRSQNERDKLSK